MTERLGGRTMRAAVITGPSAIAVQDVPIPVPGRHEVLVEVVMSGTCGSDLSFFERKLPFTPDYGAFIPGHEWTGRVAELGADVDEFAIGERVAIAAHRGCGYCRQCKVGRFTVCENFGRHDKGHRATGITAGGGFAQYVIHHVGALVSLPDEVSHEDAVLATTAGTSLHGISRVPGGVAGLDVAVVGPGAIGLMAAQAARALGAASVTVIGSRESKLAAARALGIKSTATWDAVAHMLDNGVTRDQQFDVVVETSGSSDVLRNAIALTRPGGHVLALAYYKDRVPLDISEAVRKEVSIITSRGEGGRSVATAVELFATQRMVAGDLITHRVALEDIQDAFALLRDREAGAIKIIVEIQS